MFDFIFHELLVLTFFLFAPMHKSEFTEQTSRITNHLQIFNLYIIVDSNLYWESRLYSRSIENRIASIFILINKIFLPVKVQFKITYLEIWKVKVIDMSTEDYMIQELKHYKKTLNEYYHDCLHLFIKAKKSFKSHGHGELMTMCSKSSCLGYTMDSMKQDVTDTAYTVSHELAHNIGLGHDTSECQCHNCIMATGIEITSRSLSWSKCSTEDFQSILKIGYPICKPSVGTLNNITIFKVENKLTKEKVWSEHSIDISICGNGIVEDGEECDCWENKECEKCCNVLTCKLLKHSQCASGSCCNLSICQIMSAGTICREVNNSCDLPEYCDGINENCGENTYKQDGTNCSTLFGEMAYCVSGNCKNHLSQCRFLWGQTAKKANKICYEENMVENHEFKNCGVSFENEVNQIQNSDLYWATKPCTNKNFLCGRLWCVHENEKLMQFGVSKTLSEKKFRKSELHFCESSRFELDWRSKDIGMVPDGAPCGNNKFCFNAQCIDGNKFFDKSCHCFNNGICDNRKVCHCFIGYLPPNCSITSPNKNNSRSSVSTKTKIFNDVSNNSKPHIEMVFWKKLLISIFGSLLLILLLILLRFLISKKLKKICENNLKTISPKFIDDITFKASFLQLKQFSVNRSNNLPISRKSKKKETETI